MGPENFSMLQYWGCRNPVCEVCKQKLLFGDRLHNIWKETTEQRVVPCSSGSSSQGSTPQLPDSTHTDLNSLPSLLFPQKNLHVQPPNRTYSKLPMSSSSIQTPLSIHEDSLCTSSQICAVKCTPPAASMFAVEGTSCPLTRNCVIDVFDSSTHQSWLEV